MSFDEERPPQAVVDPSRELLEDRAIATLGKRHSRLVNVVTVACVAVAIPVAVLTFIVATDLQFRCFDVAMLNVSAVCAAVVAGVLIVVGSRALKRAAVKFFAPRWLDEFARQGCNRAWLETIISPW